MILETCFSFDVIFIQEPSWTTICSIPSSKSRKDKVLVRVPNHPNWLTFANNISNANLLLISTSGYHHFVFPFVKASITTGIFHLSLIYF